MMAWRARWLGNAYAGVVAYRSQIAVAEKWASWLVLGVRGFFLICGSFFGGFGLLALLSF